MNNDNNNSSSGRSNTLRTSSSMIKLLVIFISLSIAEEIMKKNSKKALHLIRNRKSRIHKTIKYSHKFQKSSAETASECRLDKI